jgi:hypothetical protein
MYYKGGQDQNYEEKARCMSLTGNVKIDQYKLMAGVLRLMACIREITGLNLGRHNDYLD